MNKKNKNFINFFLENKKKLFEKLENNSLVLLYQNDILKKENGFYQKIINNDLFYFSSIQDEVRLVFFKNSNGIKKEFIFLKEDSKKNEIWGEENILKKKEIENVFKKKDIFYFKDFDKIFNEILLKNSKKNNLNFYLIDYENSNLISYNRKIDEVRKFKKKEKLKLDFKSFKKISTNLRQIKSPFEIQMIKKSLNINYNCFLEILKFLKENKNKKNIINENDIFCIISNYYFKNFSNFSYFPIIAGGENALKLHYKKNNSNIKKDDLILVDFGCEFLNYDCDITRVIPRNLKFSNHQKKIYDCVTHVNKKLINFIRPKMKFLEVEIFTLNLIKEKLIFLNLLDKKFLNLKIDLKNYKDKKIIFLIEKIREFYPHSFGHSLGLSTHDLCDYDFVEENMVLTIEPGIYIKKQKIGIRIEDNILIGKNKNINLSKNFLKEINEIENF